MGLLAAWCWVVSVGGRLHRGGFGQDLSAVFGGQVVWSEDFDADLEEVLEGFLEAAKVEQGCSGEGIYQQIQVV